MGVRLRATQHRPRHAHPALPPAASATSAHAGRVKALPAVMPPPIAQTAVIAPPLPQRETLPQITGEDRPPSYVEAPESTNAWMVRHTSFAISLVVHLMTLIGLALWAFHEPNEKTSIVLYADPAHPEIEEVVQIEPPGEFEHTAEIMSAATGDMTSMPDSPEIAAIDMTLDTPGPTGAEFTRQLIESDLLQPVGGGGSGGGGTGGQGPGSEVGELMQFVERLERAGAKTGDIQISLIWDNYNDLDLHVFTPRGETIFFGHRKSRCRGELDVDMNAGQGTTREPVENIYWGKGKAPYGKFKVAVHHYRNHGDPDPTAYEMRIIVDGKTQVVKGEISHGSPRLIVYEFTRNAPGFSSPGDSPDYTPRRKSRDDSITLSSALTTE